MEAHTGVHADDVRVKAVSATGGNAAISTVWALPNTVRVQQRSWRSLTAMLTGNIGRRGVGVNPSRAEQCSRFLRYGLIPRELPGYRPVSDDAVRGSFEAVGRDIGSEPGHRIPNMFEEALSGAFKGLYCQGEDIAQSDPNTQHVKPHLSRWSA